ncbi:MAG TPA: menaquinone biosynthesis protein [Terracidiphilus sp.]|nr:menaquinone biosynthesis protein [Terracidiphilus sp.]
MPSSRLRIAAISFLNPAPLMWDFEHEPQASQLAERYELKWMLPSQCADELASGAADIGLVPIAALATNPHLRILPGCVIGSKGPIRSLLLVRRAAQSLNTLRSVAADTASRTTVTYARLLMHKWGNPAVQFVPMAADLDAMLAQADAAVVIGDPALLAPEQREEHFLRTGERLVFHDLAEEWRALTGLPWVSAVWGVVPNVALDETVAADFIRSRDHGLQNIDALVEEWAAKLPLKPETIRAYLTENIHYVLDNDCMEGMRGFFSMAAEVGALPSYELPVESLTR